MAGEYDCVIMGTGLKECILSGLLSTAGMKVRRASRLGCSAPELRSVYWLQRAAPGFGPPASPL